VPVSDSIQKETSALLPSSITSIKFGSKLQPLEERSCDDSPDIRPGPMRMTPDKMTSLQRRNL
jgi:hypothetical protein